MLNQMIPAKSSIRREIRMIDFFVMALRLIDPPSLCPSVVGVKEVMLCGSEPVHSLWGKFPKI